MTEDDAGVISKKLSQWLEGAFESVALTRRTHFTSGRGVRPDASEIDSIVRTYANQNFVIAGGANLIPGPLGAIAVIPEITLIIRNQIQMIYDIGVAHGKESQLNANLLMTIFATVLGGGVIGVAAVHGSQVLVKRASLRVAQQVVVWLGGKITQRALKALLAKWVPIVGAAAMAIWARHSTVDIGNKAAELLAKDIVEVEE